MIYRLLFFQLMFIATNSFSQTSQFEINLQVGKIIEHNGDYSLLRNHDTLSVGEKHSNIDSTISEIFTVSSRKLDTSDRTEIIIEYTHSQGEPMDYHSWTNTHFIIIDSLTGKKLFHCFRSRWISAGNDYSQGFSYYGYEYEIRLNKDGSIEIFNIVQDVQSKMSEPGKINLRLPVQIFPDKQEGTYRLVNGQYVLNKN